MKTLFDEMEHAVKNWWLSLILGILYIIVALWFAIRTGKQLHCPQRHLQHFDADKWYHRNHLLHQQPARHLVLGMVPQAVSSI